MPIPKRLVLIAGLLLIVAGILILLLALCGLAVGLVALGELSADGSLRDRPGQSARRPPGYRGTAG